MDTEKITKPNENKQKNGMRSWLLALIMLCAATLAYSLYDTYIMRRNFRDLYALILKNPGTASNRQAQVIKIDTQGLPALGSPDAPLELVLVSDFECPFCEALGGKILQSLRTKLVDRGLLRIYYISRPLASHKNGQAAARVAMAAHAQGKFWAMYDELFSGQPLGQDLYKNSAQKIGLDMKQYAADLTSRETENELQRHRELGDSINPPGVPAILYNGKVLVGDAAWSSLETELGAALTQLSDQVSPALFAALSALPYTSIVDVRSMEEFSTGYIPGAIQADYNSADFIDFLKVNIPVENKILLYCKSGYRSALAWNVLAQAGFTGHFSMAGGINAWIAEGNEIKTPE